MRGLGYIDPKRGLFPSEMRMHSRRMRSARATEVFPDTTLGLPDIRNQFGSSACTGFGVAQGVHIHRQVLGLPSEFPSPLFPYWGSRREEVGSDDEIADTGATLDGVIDSCGDFGVCEWKACPFDMDGVNRRPGEVAFTAAQACKVSISPIIGDGEDLWLGIRHAVAIERTPVFIALEVTPGFDDVGPDGFVDDPFGPSRGRHANLVYGITEHGALDANSWGDDWGDGGTCILTPRFIAENVIFAATLRVNP